MQQRVISSVAKHLHFCLLGHSHVWSVFRRDLNVEQAKWVFHVAQESLFAMIDQLRIPHNCMPECEDILAVTASLLMSVFWFCLCDIRTWKCHVWWFLGMEKLLNLLQRRWVGKAGPITWSGRSCEFTLLGIFWSNVTEHIYIQPYGILLTERHTEINPVLRPALFFYSTQH
jgi:hypothetical protein